jgi:hypothetical protein
VAVRWSFGSDSAAAQRQELTLLPARPRTIGLLLVCLLFTGGGGWMIGKGEIAGWLCAVFFGLGCVVFSVNLWPGASYLRLGPEGFVVCSLFRRWPLVRWDAVSEFRVVRVRTKMVVYDQEGYKSSRLARVNRALVGAGCGLPDTYGRKPEALAELLNEWRARALSASAAR